MDEASKFDLNSLPLPILRCEEWDFYFNRLPTQARTVTVTPSTSWQVGVDIAEGEDKTVYDADEPTIVENNTELPGDQDDQS